MVIMKIKGSEEVKRLYNVTAVKENNTSIYTVRLNTKNASLEAEQVGCQSSLYHHYLNSNTTHVFKHFMIGKKQAWKANYKQVH